MDSLSIAQKIAVWALPLIFAVVFHEVAHGFVADRCGDPTARYLGRLSINPIRHIDLFGTILLPCLMLMTTNFIFGWAKPVPVNFHLLRHPRRDKILVAIAGPAANLMMAFLWLGFLKLSYNQATLHSPFSAWAILTAQIGIFINLVLMILNLLPLPPLDGSRIVSALLPQKISFYYDKLEPFGMIILIALLLSGILAQILRPLLTYTLHLLPLIGNV